MANRQQLSILRQGSIPWNEWRKKNPDIQPDLHEAGLASANLQAANLSATNLNGADLASTDLQGANLFGATLLEADLHEANLHKADLGFADLTFADLSRANLTAARLWKADLTAAKLAGAELTSANLTMAILRETDLTEANLNEAVLNYAILVEANLRKANLTGCSVCGLSAWDVHLEGANQTNLVITFSNEPAIAVDTLDIAQFIYFLLNNKRISEVVTTIRSNVVLIMGRFTPERKPILEAIRDQLRKRGYSPILFNFEQPLSRDFSEKVKTLAHIARFIIADLTPYRSISQELRAILPKTVVPVQPLLNGMRRLYTMFPDFKQYPWVLPGYHYKGLADLLASLEEKVIKPAEEKARELERLQK